MNKHIVFSCVALFAASVFASPVRSICGARGHEFSDAAKKEVIPLPDGYVAVEYLQSSGAQYINLKTMPSSDMVVFVSCMPKGSSYGGKGFWGWLGGGGTKRCGLASGGGGGFYVNTGSTGFYLLNPYSQSTWYDITMTPTTYEVAYNKTTVTGTYAGFVAAYFNTMYLFSFYASSSCALATRIRRFKLYKGGELFYDLIPVKDADGIGCMYDIVTEQTFYNKGTGTFTVGDEL